MRNTLTYGALVAVLLLAGSCQKKEAEATTPFQACQAAASTVKTITSAAGIVRFNTTLKDYVVSVHQPGTIDAVDVGIVCGSLPAALQVDGTNVTVSGTFKEYGQPAPGVNPAGTTYYYLELTSIQ